MQRPRSIIYAAIAVVCASVTMFFGYFGAILVYTALTFDGEGSLGHVGMYIAAGLFPFLALIFAAFTFLAWRAAYRPSTRS
jgi:hypothetical protein